MGFLIESLGFFWQRRDDKEGWFRNPKKNTRDGAKTLVNNGINYQAQLVQDVFHQQYVIEGRGFQCSTVCSCVFYCFLLFTPKFDEMDAI